MSTNHSNSGSYSSSGSCSYGSPCCALQIFTSDVSICSDTEQQVKVTVTDCNDEPIEGITVEVTVDNSSIATITCSDCITDANGCVMATVKGKGPGKTNFTAKATDGGTEATDEKEISTFEVSMIINKTADDMDDHVGISHPNASSRCPSVLTVSLAGPAGESKEIFLSQSGVGELEFEKSTNVWVKEMSVTLDVGMSVDINITGVKASNADNDTFVEARVCGKDEPLCDKEDLTVKRRQILLFGYWPPTDIGIATRHGMLWEFREDPAGPNASALQKKYRALGYDVQAFSPKFAAPVAVTTNGTPRWGQGTGDLKVAYHPTSNDFWKLMDRRPIAIMSFSRGKPGKSWEFEAKARNITTDPPNNWSPEPGQPHVGGSAIDDSPLKGKGIAAKNPIDPTKTATDSLHWDGPRFGDGMTGTPLPANTTRASNLAMVKMSAAIFAIPGNMLVPAIDLSGDVGGYVSEYMAYLVAWYRDYAQAELKPWECCRFAGHTHVGINAPVPACQKAVEAQMDVLIDQLSN